MIVARFKNIVYNQEDDTMEITMTVVDENFKNKLLKNPDLNDILIIKGKEILTGDKNE